MWKVNDNDDKDAYDDNDDDGKFWSEKLSWAFGSGELTRDLKGLQVDSPCDKHWLFNYYEWCTS